MDDTGNELLEPGDAYVRIYKDSFLKNTVDLLNGLIQKSGINEEENRNTAEKYRNKVAENKELKKRISSKKTQRVLLIVLIWILGAVGSVLLSDVSVYLIIPVLGICIALTVLTAKKIKKIIDELTLSSDKLTNEENELYSICISQVTPLLDLFESKMTRELITKTVPTIEFDRVYDNRRCDYLSGKYGFPVEDSNDYSTVAVISGEIIGNPFIFEKRLCTWIGQQKYVGSMVITWTTHERGSDGKMRTVHHSQTLYASVYKPKPFYRYETRLVYGNEAAPDLSFSHSPSHAEKYDEKKLRSVVKAGIKSIRKKAEKNLESGFTEMGNEEFDVLFGGLDRDHEVQYRLLFTPLAQKNMLALMKGKSPYGDDFKLVKQKCVNTVVSEHSNDIDMEDDTHRYYSYDVAIIRDLFINYNTDFFEKIYFDFAPLMSIPLYQQHKPHEYIYRDVYNRNYTNRSSELLANKIGREFFKHPLSMTDTILKTSIESKNNSVDNLTVSAYSYKGLRRVDYVPVYGGDGRYHNVPVPWILYLPVCQETSMDVCDLKMDDISYRTSEYSSNSCQHSFSHGLYATLGPILKTYDDSPDDTDDMSESDSDIKEE